MPAPHAYDKDYEEYRKIIKDHDSFVEPYYKNMTQEQYDAFRRGFVTRGIIDDTYDYMNGIPNIKKPSYTVEEAERRRDLINQGKNMQSYGPQAVSKALQDYYGNTLVGNAKENEANNRKYGEHNMALAHNWVDSVGSKLGRLGTELANDPRNQDAVKVMLAINALAAIAELTVAGAAYATEATLANLRNLQIATYNTVSNVATIKDVYGKIDKGLSYFGDYLSSVLISLTNDPKKIASVFGLTNLQQTAAKLSKTPTLEDLTNFLKDLTELPAVKEIADKIPSFFKNPSTWFNFATGNWFGLLREMFFHQIDPLALDLNGNGIETLAANGHDGALFDHERLGIRTATGWIHSNDGILVYDRNGDGKINDGGEIFGDNTLLKNGKTAAHGFEAAADLDDNGDGKLDAADSAFGKLGVWRDLNHNGISEEGEIFALKDLRIKSLNLGYTQADKDLGNGNTLAEVGSYTDEDGNEHIMGDLRLSADRLHSRYSNSIPLTDEQQQEVNLRGSGRLRDLREAAAQSSELAEVLQQYKNAASKEEQFALRHKLLKAWADTDPQRIKDFFASALMMQSEGRQGIGLTPSQVKRMGEITVMNFGNFIGQPDPERQKRAEPQNRYPRRLHRPLLPEPLLFQRSTSQGYFRYRQQYLMGASPTNVMVFLPVWTG